MTAGTAVFRSKGIRRPTAERRPRGRVPGTLVFRGAHGFAVYLPQDLHNRLLRFSSDGSGLEWIGFLAGQVFEDDEGRYVRLTGIMPHLVAERSVARVRVPAEATRAARRETERYFPDSRLLGWAHSHPRGASARFSSTDREYQADWPDPWSIGIVVEPTDSAVLRVYRGPEAELLEPSAPPAAEVSASPVGASPAADAPNIALGARDALPRKNGWKQGALALAIGVALAGACAPLALLLNDARTEVAAGRAALERTAASTEQLSLAAEQLLHASATPAPSCCSCGAALTDAADIAPASSQAATRSAEKAKPGRRSARVGATESDARGDLPGDREATAADRHAHTTAPQCPPAAEGAVR
jgi:proteasome lid subunit RPN8/RPN11